MTTLDPFARLGLPRRFAIDAKAAEANHLELSRALHPDRYVASPPGERRMALSRAIEVNEAWRTVRDPIKRAEAILALEGLEGEIGETREPKPTGEFLMEVLESRERLDEAKGAKDAGRVAAIVAEAKAQLGAVERALGETIDTAIAARDLNALRAAIPLLGRLRYAARFASEAIAADDRLSGF